MIKKILNILLYSSIGSIISFLIIINPYTFNIGYSLQSKLASCKGIEKYYFDNGFVDNYLSFYEIIDRNCNLYNTNETLSSTFFLYSPEVISNCKGKPVDCEDMSHFIKCLADLYNISCYHYTTLSAKDQWHAGIKCVINDSVIRFY